MKWKSLIIALCLTFSMGLSKAYPGSADRVNFSTTPIKNGDRKWRIAYYEGGADSNYSHYLEATIKGLMDLGWIKKAAFQETESNDSAKLWRWLSQSGESSYIDFVPDAFYSCKWSNEIRIRNRRDIMERFAKKKDIDLIFAMGTWAGKDLANDQHSVPTMVMSTSDPVGAGIIKSFEDSGLDHVHARSDPNRYERQIKIFHDIIGFKKLGVAFEDTIYGRSYSAIDLIEKVSKERKFEVIKCHTLSDIDNQFAANESVLNCFDELSHKADAIYVTMQGGVNTDTIPKMVQIANARKIPTFYQAGSDGVKQGFLLSISRDGGFKPVGRFLAATMAKILNGAKPRQLKQVYEELPNIAINLKTAELIGVYLYADVLAAADELYQEIEQ